MYETDNGRRARSVYASRSLASNLQFYQYILLDLVLYIHLSNPRMPPAYFTYLYTIRKMESSACSFSSHLLYVLSLLILFPANLIAPSS